MADEKKHSGRRSLFAKINKIARRNLGIVEDMTYAADEPDETWTQRRRKVVSDAQRATGDAPIYLKAALDFGISHMRAEAKRNQVAQLNLAVDARILSFDEWKQLSSTVDAETTRIRGELSAIDAEVVDGPETEGNPSVGTSPEPEDSGEPDPTTG